MSRKHALLLLLVVFGNSLRGVAQQAEVKDTSFTLNSAFISTKKTNPNAVIPVITTGDTVQSALNVVYCTVSDHPLSLDVFYPKQQYFKGNLPAVLMVHGGGWHSGNRTMHWPMAQKMAARGYVVFAVEYRLSTSATYPAAVNDLKSAIKYIRANAAVYHVNANKIAVWGYSAGGQLAALMGSTNNNSLYKGDGCNDNYSDAVQAVIDVDGILAFIHPESVEGDDSKKLSSATKWFGASKIARPDLWQQASALNHVTKQTAPILFINSSLVKEHAGRDDMIKKLDSLHIYHEIHAFPDTPHTFIMFEPWFTPSLNYAVNFLDKVLKRK